MYSTTIFQPHPQPQPQPQPGPSDPQRTFHSLGQTNATACTSSSGIDAQGAHYSELSLRQGEDGELAVRYHATADAFTFHRRPKTLSLTKRWPSFSSDGYPAGEQNLTLRCTDGLDFFGCPLERTLMMDGWSSSTTTTTTPLLHRTRPSVPSLEVVALCVMGYMLTCAYSDDS